MNIRDRNERHTTEPCNHDPSNDKSFLSRTQVIHDPRQVKSVEELVVGRKYIDFYKDKRGMTFTIVEIDSPKKGWIRVNNEPSRGSLFTDNRCLADMGVIPYEDGMWNPSNYLVPAE